MNLKSKIVQIKKSFLAFKKTLIKNPKKRKVFIAVIILLILFVVVYSNLEIFVAALVNGYPITRFQLTRELEKQGGRQILDSLVTQKLIYQEAKKNNISILPEEIDKELTGINEQLKSQGTDLDAALAFQGQTREDLTESLKLKLTVEKLLADKTEVGEDEIKTYFEDNKSSFGQNVKLEEVRDTIIDTLKQEKISTAYQQWLQELKEKASIKYLVDF